MPSFYIIDGNSYIHRAYHALPPLTTSKGEMVNAIYGFIRMILKIGKTKEPDYMVICFDHPSPSFRHKQFLTYKAQRKKMDDELKNQMPIAREAARALNISNIEMEGYEADDLIATLATQAAKDGAEVVIVTSDKDALQLVGGNIKVWNEGKDILFDAEAVKAKYGLEPGQLVDMFALMGDSSDNVPGIKGIGEKTAVKLLQRYGGLEGVLGNAESLEGKIKELIKGGRLEAEESKSLVVLKDDVKLGISWKDCVVKAPLDNEVAEFLRKCEFKSLLDEILPGGDKGERLLEYEVEVKTVLLASELEEIVKTARETRSISIDTETTGLNPLEAALVGISIAFDEKKAFYIPVSHDYPGVPEQIGLSTVLGALKPVLEDPGVKKFGQNLKYDLLVLKRYGIEMAGLYFDTMIASYCLNPSKNSHGLKTMIFEHFGFRMTEIEELIGKGARQTTMDRIDIANVAPYAGADACAVMMAAKKFAVDLKEKNIEDLFYGIEMPLVEVLAMMEWLGIKVDIPYTKEVSSEFSGEIQKIEDDLYEIAGERFNPNSPKQLSVILFEKLKLPVIKKTKTGNCTDEEVLKVLSLQNRLPARILDYRELQKLKSTYLDALIELADKKTQRVHTSFNQAVTATGRLSSSTPNLQNIPVRTDYGRMIRKCFIVEKGCTLLSADYSQIDLRALAHITKDEVLRKAFLEKGDVHSATAKEVFNVGNAEVTPELRRIAKTINFGIIYGMSSYSLAQQLGISPAKAKEYIENYFRRYSGVKRWMQEIVKSAAEKGYVATVTGRIRYLPDINSKNGQIRGFSERMALNTPIQGTSADIIKIAMINIYRFLKETGSGTRMLVQVHDELLFEVPDEEIAAMAPQIKNKMENAMQLDVPLVADLKAGPDWNNLIKLVS